MPKIKPGKYQHYKGNYYRVLGVARHSDTLKEYVVYQAMYDSKKVGKKALWVKPTHLFLKKMNYRGKEVPRFKYIG